jgi:hypothetical protein
MSKAKKKLNKAITNLVTPFGIDKAVMQEEWMYDFGLNRVEFTLQQDWSDEAYNYFLEQEFHLKNPNVFVISLLHEVGHHMTDDDFDDMDSLFIYAQKQKVLSRLKRAKTDKERIAIEQDYFRIADEYAATAWAVDYYTNNRKECKKMRKKASKAIRNFYKKN